MHTFPFLFARPCLKHQATSAQHLDAMHRVQLPSSFPYKVLQKQSRERLLRVTASSQRERRHQRKNQSMPLSDSLSPPPKSTRSRWTSQKHLLQIRCQALRPSKDLVGGQEGGGRKTLPSQCTRQNPIQKTMTSTFPLSNKISVVSCKTFVVDWQTSFISYG